MQLAKGPNQVGSLDFWWSVYSSSTSFFLGHGPELFSLQIIPERFKKLKSLGAVWNIPAISRTVNSAQLW